MKETKRRIETMMKNKNLSMGELSKITDIPKTTISRYLNDPGTIPTDRLTIIAEALGTTPEYLIGWSDDNPKINVYGNHKENLDYFADKPEVLEMYKEIYENENLMLLFDTARELKPKELEKVLRYMKLVMEEEL